VPKIGNKIIATELRIKIIEKAINNVFGLAFIKGAAIAIAVAPHIDKPVEINRFNLLSKPINRPNR
jgi:hypothetical protein